jgi:hypothetical protein
MTKKWDKVSKDLHGAVAALDHRYTKNDVPELDESVKTLRLTGWRGERVAGQIVVWSGGEINQLRASADTLAGAKPILNFIAFAHGSAGAPYDGLYADILDTVSEVNAEAESTQSLWFSLDIPANARVGHHQSRLTIRAAGMSPIDVEVELEVIGMTLPDASQWSYHLDLWQHPWAIARCHNVEIFSEEFYAIAKPLYQRLADAGQKCLTVSINDRPWSQQTYDAYSTMIDWIKQPDGSWIYDYSRFDAYVAFGEACGIGSQINCYSMVPFKVYQFYYIDAATGDRESLVLQPGTEEYSDLWIPFLKDFSRHLRETGRLEKTCIAMDERPVGDLQAVIELVKEHAPELKIVLAADKNLEAVASNTYDYSFSFCIGDNIDESFTAPRREIGKKTTFYVCCFPNRPNTFTFSPPAESVWLSWHAALRGYDGFLRWAYAHWNKDPFETTDWGDWPAGDCFLVYPGNRSSIRFERLREGIQDYEKLKILRSELNKQGKDEDIKAIDEMLATFNEAPDPEQLNTDVNKAKELLNSLSRKISQK